MIITDEMIADFKIGFHGSTLSDDQVKRGLGKVFGNRGLFDSTVPMADGGGTPMTAAEEVLVWLLVEKIGAPDDVSYSPDQAQKIITDRLAAYPSPQPRERGGRRMLTQQERDFLNRIRTGRRLGCADRAEDRLRHKLRRAGFAEVVMNPRRWVITEAGLQALGRDTHD